MKLLLGILAVILVAASFIADYKWRQWMAARKAQQNGSDNGGPPSRSRRH